MSLSVSTRQILPTPWIPDNIAGEYTLFGTTTFSSSMSPGNANAAIFIPCRFPVSARISAMSCRTANTTGNFDLGLYDSNFVLIASLGTTAMSAQTQVLNVTRFVQHGTVLYAAVALSNTSGRVAGYATGSIANLVGSGVMEQASALPLPSTATPAKDSSWTNIPLISFTII